MRTQFSRKRGGVTLTRRLRLARLEAAATRPSTVFLAGFFLMQGMFVWLYGSRYHLHPDALVATIVLGILATAAKIVIDARGELLEAEVLRDVLSHHLGRSGFRDYSVMFLLDTAIDARIRLNGQGDDTMTRSEAVALLARIDAWFDGIGTLARRVDLLRQEARLAESRQLALNARIAALKQREGQLADAALAAQLRRTIQGIGAQLQASAELAAFAERGLLRLESSVSELGTVASKFALMQSRGEDLSDASSLDDGIGTDCGQIEDFLRAANRIERHGLQDYSLIAGD